MYFTANVKVVIRIYRFTGVRLVKWLIGLSHKNITKCVWNTHRSTLYRIFFTSAPHLCCHIITDQL